MSQVTDYERKVDFNVPYETERKFFPYSTRELIILKDHETAIPIEQVYLSSPEEPFNLRLREYVDSNGALAYEATLKDKGEISAAGLKRIEVSTPISEDLYNFYKSADIPVLRKIRAEPVPKVTIDFYENGTVQMESEDEEQWKKFTEQYGIHSFVDVTGSHQADNERRAHAAYESTYGKKAYELSSDVTAGQVIKDILERKDELANLTVHVGGRSGSGKSTIVREVISGLNAFGVSSIVLSTDDYHRGARWLQEHNEGEPWQHWDERIAYNLDEMRHDLLELKAGLPVAKREIDWSTAESYSTSLLYPADVVVIEGIYASDPSITDENDLTYILQTPLATCVGRRLLRDLRERPQFSDAAKSLLYMLTDAEPAYRKQHGISS